ncbi:hypothetical protein IKP85_07090 [bacterium]|nr:hypothetical protein [bacterium]
MISTVTQKPSKSNVRYQHIRYSGYVALGSIGACALTGMKSVNFPHKMRVHKYSAILTAVSSLWHFGAIKRWDKVFNRNN